MDSNHLIPHLFRTEFRKIASVLSKYFGPQHIQLAEDVASETFMLALETWTYKGIPENPTAWLYAIAKNKAINHLHRLNLFENKITKEYQKFSPTEDRLTIDLSEQNIYDSQLQMLFAICHPSIPVESQIGLALRILCGFGIEEIANAFLTNKEVINKRLFRAKEKLREENIHIEFPTDVEIENRLDVVLKTLYLVFSEGYYSETNDEVLREDLCLEAMRVTYLLLENSSTNLPKVNALMALMCFHSSRFPARKNGVGELILYEDQDEGLWNQELISKGAQYLQAGSKGSQLSTYHLEAAIASWHTVKKDSEEKWSSILQLYNHLLQLEYSPIAALNRTYALSKVYGKEKAIVEAEKLQLTQNRFYYTLLGELYQGIDSAKAKLNLENAYRMAKTELERTIIKRKLEEI
jgi:RNA polymerase sigma-70 factor (ECF subfamily)